MRDVTNHILGHSDVDVVLVRAADEPSFGGANHVYEFARHDDNNPMSAMGGLAFQHGGVKEHGVNGVNDVAVLAVLIDRLKGFQRGELSCEENEAALVGLEQAMYWLNMRRYRRIGQGVEGTMNRHYSDVHSPEGRALTEAKRAADQKAAEEAEQVRLKLEAELKAIGDAKNV